MDLKYIHLYNGSYTEVMNFHELLNYLQQYLKKIQIDLREEFISHFCPDDLDDISQQIARVRIKDVNNYEQPLPLEGEIKYEKNRITSSKNIFGVLYDGFKLQSIYQMILPEEERNSSHLHIIFTNQLIVTWDENDKRYHLRTSVYGFPSIISINGLIEAPAKPRQFYLKLRFGIPREELKNEFKDKMLDYDDERLNEVIKGYALQALFYHLIGEPFCSDRNCRLYNAHWQEELIQAQLKSPYQLCQYHKNLIESM